MQQPPTPFLTVRTQPCNPWLVGLCAVTFDVDMGQKVKFLTPDGALSEEERAAVAFHSFPDSMSMELYSRNTIRDSSFFFRVRRNQPASDHAGSKPTAGAVQYKYLYGFTFCRQRQDEKLRRGGEQNSVVVLSEQPFSSILTPASHVLGPLYFAEGPSALANAFGEVAAWPAPVPGALMQLALAGQSINGRVPAVGALPPPRPKVHPSVQAILDRRASRTLSGRRSGSSLPPSVEAAAPSALPGRPTAAPAAPPAATAAAGEGDGGASSKRHGSMDSVSSGSVLSVFSGSASSLTQLDSGDLTTPPAKGQSPLRRSAAGLGVDEAAHGVFAEVDVYTPFQAVLRHLWTLWELVLAAEPLLVAAPTPAECAGAVAALLALVAPLPYAADFRPYYTIHDPSARHLTSGQLPSQQNGLPRLIGITNLYFVKAMPSWPNVLAVGNKESIAGSPNSAAAGQPPPPSSTSMLNPGAAMRALKRRQQGASQLLSQHTQDLWGSYKPLTRPDSALLASLVPISAAEAKGAAGARRAAQHSKALRRHFQELTAALLAPFRRYFEPGADGTVPRWSSEPFLASIPTAATADAQLLSRLGGSTASLQALYGRFTASPNFAEWFRERQRPVEHLLEPLPCAGKAASEADVEVELVQAFVSLELQLQEAMATSSGSSSSSRDDSSAPVAASTATASSASSSSTTSSSTGSAAPAGSKPDGNSSLVPLQRNMVLAFFRLPNDLKQTMVSSPQRRQLLQSLVASPEEQHALQQLIAGLT